MNNLIEVFEKFILSIKIFFINILKNDFRYTNVTYHGVPNNSSEDITHLIEKLIDDGYTNLYFPNGTYNLNLEITKSDINIKGKSKKNTIFKPYYDKSVITLNSIDNNIDNCSFNNFKIQNTVNFVNSKGIEFKGNNENDRHIFKNIIIENNFLHSIYIQGRCIWSIFENIWIDGCLESGLHIIDGGSKNLNTFNNVSIRNSQKYGIYINSGSEPCKCFKFLNCNIENNCLDISVDNQYAIYLNNIDEFYFDNCYIENNKNDISISYAIYSIGDYTRCLNIKNCLIWGHSYGIEIVSKIMSGVIDGNRIINSIQDVIIGSESIPNGDNESNMILGANTISKPVIKKHDINMNCYITTLNPLSLPYIHANNNSTPNVQNTNVVMSWTNEPITNFLNGTQGQIVIVKVYGDANKTFSNNDYIQLKNSDDVVINANNTIAFMYFNNKWIEIFRNIS